LRRHDRKKDERTRDKDKTRPGTRRNNPKQNPYRNWSKGKINGRLTLTHDLEEWVELESALKGKRPRWTARRHLKKDVLRRYPTPDLEEVKATIPGEISVAATHILDRRYTIRKVKRVGVAAGVISIGVSGFTLGQKNASDLFSGDGQQGSPTSPESISPEATNPAEITRLTEQYITAIANSQKGENFDHNKKYATEALTTLKKLESYAKEKGVRTDVLFAQLLHEPTTDKGLGTSDKAQLGHNYLGRKAFPPNDEWIKQGKPTFEAPTWEVVNGQTVQITATWRKYASMEECLKDTIDYMAKRYPNAVKNYDNLSAYLDGMSAYATDPKYKGIIMKKITDFYLYQLLHPQLIVPKTEASPSKVAGNIKLDASKYKEYEIPKDYKLVENNLNKINLTVEGYNNFKKSIQDISSQTGHLDHFNREPLPREKVKYLYAHFTVSNYNPPKNGMQHAVIMSGSDAGVSSAYLVNEAGEYYILTWNRTGHVKGRNFDSRGTEVAAWDQKSVKPNQYEALIYGFIHELEQGKYVDKGKPVSQIIDDMIRGHGEEYGKNDNNHTDFGRMVMDPIRLLMKDFMINKLGYTTGITTKATALDALQLYTPVIDYSDNTRILAARVHAAVNAIYDKRDEFNATSFPEVTIYKKDQALAA
jgi:flagellum-specific peptidoglycan hydrolase FlgJ